MSPARLRLGAVVAGVLVAGLVLLSWTQPWFELALDGGEGLSIGGQSAAPALSALGLASLALVGALSIAGRRVRVALGVIELVIGVAVAVVAAGALASPVTASASAITEATAVSGPRSLAALVTTVAVTPWPAVAVAAGILTALVGLAVLATAHRWPRPTRKYEATPSDDGGTPVGAWDRLSEGADPT